MPAPKGNQYAVGHGQGRPEVYTEELAATILGRLSDGQSLKEICSDDDMPARSTVYKWIFEKKDFSDRYDKAREIQAECLADDIVEIADDGTNDWMQRNTGDGEAAGWQVNGEAIQRSRLRVDARKWVAARLLQGKYGDSLNVKADHTVTHESKDLSESAAFIVGIIGIGPGGSSEDPGTE